MYGFAIFRTIRTFGNAIRNTVVTLDMAHDDQNQLANKKIDNLPTVQDQEISG